jgi:hypothetical protein
VAAVDRVAGGSQKLSARVGCRLGHWLGTVAPVRRDDAVYGFYGVVSFAVAVGLLLAGSEWYWLVLVALCLRDGRDV